MPPLDNGSSPSSSSPSDSSPSAFKLPGFDSNLVEPEKKKMKIEDFEVNPEAKLVLDLFQWVFAAVPALLVPVTWSSITHHVANSIPTEPRRASSPS